MIIKKSKLFTNTLVIAGVFILPFLILAFNIYAYDVSDKIYQFLKDAEVNNKVRALAGALHYLGLSLVVTFLLKIKLWQRVLIAVLLVVVDLPLLLLFAISASCARGVCL